MSKLTDEEMLRITYAAAYDQLRKHPEFDGRPRPGHPGLLRRAWTPARSSHGPARPMYGACPATTGSRLASTPFVAATRNRRCGCPEVTGDDHYLSYVTRPA